MKCFFNTSNKLLLKSMYTHSYIAHFYFVIVRPNNETIHHYVSSNNYNGLRLTRFQGTMSRMLNMSSFNDKRVTQ